MVNGLGETEQCIIEIDFKGGVQVVSVSTELFVLVALNDEINITSVMIRSFVSLFLKFLEQQ